MKIVTSIIMAAAFLPVTGFSSGPVHKHPTKNSEVRSFRDQSITVDGKVTDEAGKALPGVSINEKGTRNGTVTDSHGNFELNVRSSESILIISFIGYTVQEVSAGQVPLNIILQKNVSSLDLA